MSVCGLVQNDRGHERIDVTLECFVNRELIASRRPCPKLCDRIRARARVRVRVRAGCRVRASYRPSRLPSPGLDAVRTTAVRRRRSRCTTICRPTGRHRQRSPLSPLCQLAGARRPGEISLGKAQLATGPRRCCGFGASSAGPLMFARQSMPVPASTLVREPADV